MKLTEVSRPRDQRKKQREACLQEKKQVLLHIVPETVTPDVTLKTLQGFARENLCKRNSFPLTLTTSLFYLRDRRNKNVQQAWAGRGKLTWKVYSIHYPIDQLSIEKYCMQ